MFEVRYLKQYGGMALILVGAILLVVCRVARCQTNAELLTGLSLILLGFFLHLWLQKRGEKY